MYGVKPGCSKASRNQSDKKRARSQHVKERNSECRSRRKMFQSTINIAADVSKSVPGLVPTLRGLRRHDERHKGAKDITVMCIERSSQVNMMGR